MDKDLQYQDTGGKDLNTAREGASFRSGSDLGVRGDIQAGSIEGEDLTTLKVTPGAEQPPGNWESQDVGGGFGGTVHAEQGVGDDYRQGDLPGHMPGEVRT